MSYGAKFSLADGSPYLQIDDNYISYGLKAKGRATTYATLSTNPAGVNHGVCNAPILVILPDPGTLIYYPVVIQQSGQTKHACQRFLSVSGPYTWWLFDLMASIPRGDGNYGMIIRNAANQVVFDTRNLPLRVVSEIEFGAFDSLPTDIAVPSGKTYGLAVRQNIMTSDSYCDSQSCYDQNWASYIRFQNSRLGFSVRFLESSSGSSPYPGYSYPGSATAAATVIDVTGY